MLKKLTIFAVCAITLLSASEATAQQKYGHLNLGNLMEQMPEIATANAALVALNDSLTVVDSLMTANFQEEYQTFAAKAQAGELTRIQMQEAETTLQKQQQVIMAFEESANEQVEAKKSALLSPMLKRIDDAVKEVAKEQGYAMVFDTSTGFMLFVDDSEDMMDLVKAKLNITK